VIREALSASVDALRAAGVEDPRLDAELLLAEATGWERARLVADSEAEIPPAAARRFAEMVRRRLRREPVAYILGRRGFRHLELAVDPRVLIPRPESEPAGALAVAAANAERLGLAARVELFEGALPPRDEEFDLVVANLPYVSEREWGDLRREVTEWEPREALLAGPDGLDVLRSAVPALAAVTGTLALEIGQGQAAAVGELLRAAGHPAIESRPDLAGIERLVIGRRGPVA